MHWVHLGLGLGLAFDSGAPLADAALIWPAPFLPVLDAHGILLVCGELRFSGGFLPGLESSVSFLPPSIALWQKCFLRVSRWPSCADVHRRDTLPAPSVPFLLLRVAYELLHLLGKIGFPIRLDKQASLKQELTSSFTGKRMKPSSVTIPLDQPVVSEALLPVAWLHIGPSVEIVAV